MTTLSATSPTPSVASRALIALFLAALAAPAVDMALRDARKRGPEQEGRATRPAPVWRADARMIHHYPDLFEAHFSDTLGLRDHLLHLYSRRCLNIFGTSPSSDVHVGKDGWLFYSGEKSFEVHRGLYPFTDAQLGSWQKMLEARRDFAASIGAAYIFVIGPNKEEIYPDYLPAGVESLGGPTRLAQLVDWMRAHSDVELLDLRPSLRAARSQDNPGSYLYFEEGTHWNGRGCLLAAVEIVRAAEAHFPELKTAPKPQFHAESDAFPESWRRKMYIDRPPHLTRDVMIARRGDLRAVTTKGLTGAEGSEYAIPGADLPSVLMFHDSFGPTVLWHLSEHFATARSRHDPLFGTKDLIEEPPDLVVELFVERALVSSRPETMLPNPPRAVVALNADRGHRSQARRFEASTDVRLLLDLEAAAADGVTSGQLKLDIAHDERGAGLGLSRRSALDSLISPPLASGEARDLLLLLEIDSPVASTAELFFQRRGRNDWPAAQRVVVALEAGRNRHWVPLHGSFDVGRVRLRPGKTDGERIVLRRLEVRGVDRP